MSEEEDFPDLPPVLTRQNARRSISDEQNDQELFSDEETEEEQALFLITIAIIAALQFRHSTPKPIMRPFPNRRR